MFTVFVIGWTLPLGTLTGTWRLSSGFSALPRDICPAPLLIHFFDDGTGRKIDSEGDVVDFEWHITIHNELAMDTRFGSYIIRFSGFGTRLSIENSLRGEWVNAAF